MLVVVIVLHICCFLVLEKHVNNQRCRGRMDIHHYMREIVLLLRKSLGRMLIIIVVVLDVCRLRTGFLVLDNTSIIGDAWTHEYPPVGTQNCAVHEKKKVERQATTR